MYRVINRNKHIEKELCITLVIYQESLHDARSAKCKILHGVIGVVIQIIFASFVWPYGSYTVFDGTLDVQELMFYTRYFSNALLGVSSYAAVSTLTDLLLTGNFI